MNYNLWYDFGNNKLLYYLLVDGSTNLDLNVKRKREIQNSFFLETYEIEKNNQLKCHLELTST